MESKIFGYMLQVSIVFTLLFLLYKVLVSNLTFHSSNRWILLSIPIISIVLPILDITSLIPLENLQFNSFSIEVPSLYKNTVVPINETNGVEQKASISYLASNFWSTVYLCGVLAMLIKFIRTSKQVFRIKRNSKKLSIQGTEVFLAKVSTPFSYFNWIFIPEEQGRSINKLILEHEVTHVKKMHGLDLLLTEIYAIIFWFNPIIYFYRKSIKALHEYQADQGVLAKNTKPSEYLELILNTIQNRDNHNSLSYFNNPIIKKRIDMITKAQSKKRDVFKYILLLLFIMLVSIAFSVPKNATKTLIPELESTEISKIQPPSIFPLKEFNPKHITSIYGQKGKHAKSNIILTHQGIDIKAAKGTPVMATADGTIAKASLENEWGNLLVIMHSDGYQTFYAHLDSFNVEENQTIKKGEIIGYVGSTGLSSGHHLHYEVHKGIETLNPMDFF